MPFVQFNIAKSFNQTRDIFDIYAYETDDTKAEVLAADYFIESRFNKDPKWIGSHIEVYASDGYMRIRMASAGTAELLLDNSGGGGLTPEEQAFVTSGVNAPDDQLLLARSGILQPSTASQSLGETTIKNDEGAYEAGPSPGYQLGLAWKLNSAGQNVNFLNSGRNENYHPVWQRYAVGRENIFARDRIAEVTIPIETVFADTLTDPIWSVVIPSVAGEQGQTATFTDVKFDATSALTNIDVLININGVDYRTVTIPLATVGDFRFEYEPPTDFYVGDVITFTVSSKDGPVVLQGNSATNTPYVIQDVLLWDDVPVGLLSDQVPKYRNAFSSDLVAFDGQTYAADATLGTFTITADSEANSFSVFDYAGNWSAGSRTIIVSIGVDSYFLTRKNREYFFYKDELNIWQWYYKSNFRG